MLVSIVGQPNQQIDLNRHDTGYSEEGQSSRKAYFSLHQLYLIFNFYKNCICTSFLGKNGQRNVDLEEFSISEVIYTYIRTPNFVHPVSEIVKVCSVFHFLSGCTFIFFHFVNLSILFYFSNKFHSIMFECFRLPVVTQEECMVNGKSLLNFQLHFFLFLSPQIFECIGD